ncbi:hypothetical protein ES703_106001 [subsurface metagenome]
MPDKEDAEVLKALLPAVGIGTVAVVAIGLLGRAFTERRVYSQDGQYLVPVRYGQLHDIRDFVQPANPDVIAAYSQIGPDPWRLYDFVCRNIDYRRDIGEFWAFPSEVLAWEAADCEDTSNLLTSLLCCGGINAYTVIGDYQGYGHAWVDRGGQLYETTYTKARPVPDPEHYTPYCLFNDREVIELWPGALGEIFELGRDEVAKLNLIAAAIGNEVPPECPSCWPFMAVGLVTGGILGTGFAMILQKGEAV